jgi:hypothetical protein
MKKKEFEQYLSRRIMTENGWEFFCSHCGCFKSENDFYKSNKTKWGIDNKCKIHYSRKDPDDDGEMNYLKLGPIKESDFIEVQKFLSRIGYKFGPDEKSVHEQFMDKYPELKN